MKYQIHFNKKFYLDKKTGYWISTSMPHMRAHVWVWKYFNGHIPKGYHIHHKDGNKSNNYICNLELIEAAEHLRIHMTDERRLMSGLRCNQIRHLTKKWHASEEGIKWHKEHAIRCKLGKWEPIEYKCDQCDKLFKSIKRSNTRFCSNACKSKWRRQNKLDHIERECPICSKEYKTSKYSRSKTCGRKCGQVLKNKIN